MKISNQVEYLRSLYKELKYAEVIQFGMITLPASLKKKRYKDALACYEYVASAYFEIGDFASFLAVMSDYEKLCLTYGENDNKMMFYYLASLLHILAENEKAFLLAAKKAIQYAHTLQCHELTVINFSNIAAVSAIGDKPEKAKTAIRLADYYKQKMPHMPRTAARAYIGALYYFAAAKEAELFDETNERLVDSINARHVFYHVNSQLAKAILAYRTGRIKECMALFEQVYLELKAQHNGFLLAALKKCIMRFGLEQRFVYMEELQQLTAADLQPIPLNAARSGYTDFSAGSLPAVSAKYLHVQKKEQVIAYVEQGLSKREAIYCIQWYFATEEIDELFGTLFGEQLLYPLFEEIYRVLEPFDAKIHVFSKNEGEAFLKNSTEAQLFTLLKELEQKLQKHVAASLGNVKIPIHFGFIHTDQLQEHQRTYEQLAAFAAASLYYAKSRGQLYIYS